MTPEQKYRLCWRALHYAFIIALCAVGHPWAAAGLFALMVLTVKK